MLSLEQFVKQTKESLIPILRSWSICQILLWREELATLDLMVSTLTQIEITSKFQLRICYNPVYNEPQLLFRIWKLNTELDDIESWKLDFPNSDRLPIYNEHKQYSITLNQIEDASIWYVVNACDTEKNVGQDLTNYITRWFSYYGRLFDRNIGVVFATSIC